MNWYCLAVRPQQEQRVVGDLALVDVEAFSPQETHKTCRHNKWVEHQRPMLPGYVFAKCEDIPWPVLHHNQHVRSVIGIDGNPSTIPGKTIDDLRAWTGERQPFDIGERAQISRGPMQGDYVTIASIVGKRVRALKTFLGSTRPIEMPIEWLKAG